MDGDMTEASGRAQAPGCGARRRTTRPRGMALLAAALVLTGCTSAPGTAKPGDAAPATSPSTGGRPATSDLATTPGRPFPSAEPTGGSLTLSAIRQGGLDYDPVPSPEALAGRMPIVAGGVVDGWQRGPTLGVLPGDPPAPYVLMRVRITHPLKGVRTTPSLHSGVVFIEFDRPYEESVADFAKRIPAGVRVLVFGGERPPYEMGVRSPGAPLPDGAKVMGVHPQGLVLEDPRLVRRGAERTLVGGREPLTGGSRAAWLEPRTMDEMIDRLRRFGFSE
ncbi:hypothetical protein ACQP25_12935 [Microtetraspora malaysiensis]|uniref:hypothetical protein n=1 Tax=Microtetraspora malaysiensis TaxID=161358 RepID=UPI003D8E5040